MVAYFEDLGFFFDPRNNPADVLMDILSGRGVKLRDPRGVTVEMVRQDMVQLEEYDVMDLVRHWNTKEVGDLKAAKMAAAAAMVTTSAATSAPGSTVAISVRSTVLMEETFSATPAAASPPSASSHQMVREFDDEHSAYGTPETYACDMSIRSRANTIHRYRATSYLTCQSIEMSKSGEFRRASLEDSPHHFTGPILEGHEEDMADDLPTKLVYLNSPIVDDSCSAACDPPPTQAEVTATHRRLRKACMDRGANFFMQFLYAHNRSILQQYRKINALLMEIMVATISGALMGLAIKGYDGRLVGRGSMHIAYRGTSSDTVLSHPVPGFGHLPVHADQSVSH